MSAAAEPTSMRPETYDIALDEPFGTADHHEAMLRGFPDRFTVKGLYFAKPRQQAGASWSQVEPLLRAPPALGNYLPFIDYPAVDHLRVQLVAAARRFPNTNAREAMRRLSREDILVFASSTLGRILLAATGDLHTALMLYPRSFEVAVNGVRAQAESLGSKAVRVTAGPYHAPSENLLGQLEGAVIRFGERSRARVHHAADYTLSIEMRWG